MRSIDDGNASDAGALGGGVRRVAVAAGFVLGSAVWIVGDRFEAAQRGEPASIPELLVGTASCLLLLWRLRAPVRVAILAILITAFIPGVTGAALLALFSLAVHRSARQTLPLGAAFVAAGVVSGTTGGPRIFDWTLDSVGQMAGAIVLASLAIVCGTMMRNRRQLIVSLVDLAASAEFAERERTERVRAEERSLLAGEMHDVLAHRMSLVAIHAGALEYAADLPPAEAQRAAGVIRAGVHQMLGDLRDVIGMLRDDSPDRDSLGPLPTLSDVAVLFRESASAGYPVDAIIEIDEVRELLPRQVDRAAYRVVQEGLTNARKHGEARVSVVIQGTFGAGLAVQVSQPLASPHGLAPMTLSTSPLPGANSGLLGLVERATLVGGSVEFGRRDDAFVLSAHFPLETID